jgi:hypothetical protein
LALQELGLSMPQFIDLCIMCGCDYATNIRGIGAVRALNLIKQHGSVEAAVAVRRLHPQMPCGFCSGGGDSSKSLCCKHHGVMLMQLDNVALHMYMRIRAPVHDVAQCACILADSLSSGLG